LKDVEYINNQQLAHKESKVIIVAQKPTPASRLIGGKRYRLWEKKGQQQQQQQRHQRQQ
jgi:hypothetical protein